MEATSSSCWTRWLAQAPACYAGRYVVTLSVGQVMFRQLMHVGELVTFLASVNHDRKPAHLPSLAQRFTATRSAG